MGGLVCGAILAKEGYHVTVLEMNKQIGGNLQTYVRDRNIFDSGVHYMGGLSKGQNLYQIFKYLGILDQLKMDQMDEDAFDKIVFYSDGEEYNYAQGYPLFIETLVRKFPEERKAIESFCDYMKRICAGFPLYNMREGDFMEKSEFLEIDTKTYIESLTSNKRLQNVLGGNNLLYAGVADQTPVYVHALVVNSYIESSWRMVNGGSQIAIALSRIIRNHGGVIKNRTEVSKIKVIDGVAKYAETIDGTNYEGDYFISNAHPAKTLQMTESDTIRPAYRNRIGNLENSVSIFILNISLKPKSVKYEKCNYYCFMNDDVWATMDYTDETWPQSYAFFYSGIAAGSEYAEGITVMAYMKYSEVEKWKDSFNTVGKPDDRGIEYEEFKKMKAEKLLDQVEIKFPGFRESILHYYTSTPLTFRDYMGTDDGSIYGILKDYKDPLRTLISPRTKINNLLLTGQNINLHGILGVSISALVTCSVLLGLPEIIKKIHDAQAE